MVISIVPIGNSKGIRLPKVVIDQFEIKDKIELELKNDCIILKPLKKIPRAGWETALRQMHDNEDDKLLIKEIEESAEFVWEW